MSLWGSYQQNKHLQMMSFVNNNTTDMKVPPFFLTETTAVTGKTNVLLCFFVISCFMSVLATCINSWLDASWVPMSTGCKIKVQTQLFAFVYLNIVYSDISCPLHIANCIVLNFSWQTILCKIKQKWKCLVCVNFKSRLSPCWDPPQVARLSALVSPVDLAGLSVLSPVDSGGPRIETWERSLAPPAPHAVALAPHFPSATDLWWLDINYLGLRFK